MNLDFPEHCLFCLGNIVQQDDQQLHSNGSQELNCYSHNNSNPVAINSMASFNSNFERLCKYLKIEFPIDTIKFRNVSRILSGEKRTCYEALLCGSCGEMVDGLHRLYEDLRRIQRRIDYGIRSVQSVIRSSDGEGEEVDEEGNSKKKSKIDRDSLGAGSSVVADYLEFVETFRKLVKEVEIEEPKPVVLTGEADALAKCYEKLEEDFELNSSVKPEEGAETDYVTASNLLQNEEENGEDGMLRILSAVSVSMDTNEYTNEGDDGLHFYSTDMDMFTESEDNTMDSTTTPFGSTTSGEGASFIDPLSPSTSTAANSSSSGHRSKVTFNCRYCDLTFDNPKTYYYHRKGIHTEESEHLVIPSFHEDGPFSVSKKVEFRTCPVCGETKKTKQNTLKHFMEHMLSHEITDNPITTVSQDINSADEDKPFVCDYCDQRFLLEMNLDLHKICYHESTLLIPLKCEDCGDTTSNSWEDLVTHLVEQHGGGEGNGNTIYSCKSCPMAFTSADQFLSHMQNHSLSRRLPCCECPCVSPSLKELYQHFNEDHPDLITNLKCEICEQVFIMPNTYRKHFATVHSTTVPNPITSLINVPIPIITSSSMSIIPITPSPTTNIQCPHCQETKTFKNKLTLENHIRIHHDTTVPKHSCNQCGKAFVHRSTLRYHIQQVHLGIRYSCPHCPKSFTAKSLLKGHLKLHTGQGPPVINCQFCGKIFASQTALKTHTITQHGNNEPRACDVCNKEFQNIYSMRAHKSDVHNIKQWSCTHCPQQFARVKQFEKHLATHNLQLVAVDEDDIVE